MVDVAKRAAVSVKTVSRVVNGEEGVRPDTKARVDEAIRQLGFRRNDSASDLRRGRAEGIGLIVENMSDPFYSVIGAAVERVARLQRHLLLMGSAEGSAERERDLTGAFLSRRVAGLIVVPAIEDHHWLAAELAAGTPVVFVDRPASGLSADAVLTDNDAGVRSAVEHLAARGHRNIGFLGDNPEFWTAGQRLAAFGSATAALGLRSDLTAMGPHEVEGIAALVETWTRDSDPVTALVTGNNRLSVTALRALRRVGKRLALVGFDDFELADMVEPAVTVVAQDPAAMGEQAAHLLFRRLAGEGGPARTVVLPTRLVVRDSSHLV
ncbi:LacI family DNA-binding transcriptional regulator [Actinophytocola sp. S1-96]|uniref:LacI family DNA-binding transcriptional regulator n=2 Tax=Actinophytocola gossypii TaxID=2812003 RepID=A0ABT2JAD1_9PSEU|nr:LacI family DNA-binding transcriptional regulator [Actinophytocola gossypii]